MNVRDSHVRKMAFLIVAGALRVIKAMKKKISEIPGNIRLQIEAQHIPEKLSSIKYMYNAKRHPPLATLNNEADKLNNVNVDK